MPGDGSMIFIKSFNNSAALIRNDEGQEEVVLGKGIGFGLKSGDQVPAEKIERRFIPANREEEINQVKQINSQTIDVTNKIVRLVEPLLQVKFNDFNYLALADHIDFALTRVRDHIDLNATNNRWEVQNLFPKEYAVATQVVELINNDLNVKLPESEVVLMTYHMVNAESNDVQLQETEQIAQLITGIISIIQFQYQLTLDTESFSYSRFITHLRVLLVRLIKHQKQQQREKLDPSLLSFMKVKYTRAYETAERIATYLHAKMGWTLNSDDKFYLVLHIFRVTSRQDH